MRPLAHIGREKRRPWEDAVTIGLEPRDVWIGWYRDAEHHYLCPLPCLVIRVARRGNA